MVKGTILLIDDEEDFSFLVKKNLATAGQFDIFTANNGKEGLKLARKHAPDLILLDISMPGMDGFQVLEKLKNDTKTESIPVVMLTALDDDKNRMQASLLYNEAYLTKPVSLGTLRSKIEEVLSRKHS